MDLYQEQIIDLAKNPLNRREMPDANLMHSGVNVTCGDHIRLYLKTEPQGDDAVILDASWQGEGCAISVAAASFLTEEIKGMTLESARLLTKEDLFCWMGVELGPARVKCGTLSLETLQGALLQKE